MPVLERLTGKTDTSLRSGTDPGHEETTRQIFIATSDFSIRHFVAAGCEFEPHSHSAFTITTILTGELNATVGASDLTALSGQTLLTGVGETHSARSRTVEFLSVSICPALVYEALSKAGLASNGPAVVFTDKVVLDESLFALALSIRAEASQSRPGRTQMLEALVGQMLVHLLRSQFAVRKSPSIEMSRAGPVDRRLRRAIEFMHDNYSRELGLEEIAAAAYLSEYHFARLFKQVTGMTPGAFLASIRLERARTLLAQTRKPISEIAAMVGYQSQSHFTKVFRSVTGLTPRAFRESCQPESGTHD